MKNQQVSQTTQSTQTTFPSRTLTQNKAIHKYFELLSEGLNDAGLDMKKVLKPSVDIDWTPDMIKTHLWKPIQDVMFEKKSTTELTTKQVSQVYETLNRHLAQKFGIAVGFPSNEPEMNA
jgi:hypothetical protein